MPDKQPVKEQLYREDATGKIFQFKIYPDGRTERRELSKDELDKFDFIDQKSTTQNVQLPSPEQIEGTTFSDNLLRSGGEFLGDVALGGGLALALSNPYTGIPVGALLAGAIGKSLYEDPKGTLQSMADPFTRPILHPIQTAKEDPFEFLNYLGLFGGKNVVKSATPSGTLESLKNAVRRGVIKFFETPASEQPVVDVIGRNTMTRGLQFAKKEGLDLTVGQATEKPIALAAEATYPGIQSILKEQAERSKFIANKIIKDIHTKLNIENDIGQVASWLSNKATTNYEKGLKAIGNLRQKLVNRAESRLNSATVKAEDLVTGQEIDVELKGIIEAPNTYDVASKVSESLRKITLEPTTSKFEDKLFLKQFNWFKGQLETAGTITPEKKITTLRVLYESRRRLDNLLKKMDPSDPDREKLGKLRQAMDLDLRNGFKAAGLGKEYESYLNISHEFLKKFNTVVSKGLTEKTEYMQADNVAKFVSNALKDSASFRQLADIVGEKEANAALVQTILRSSYDPKTGIFNADKLITLLSRKRAMLNMTDPTVKTKLINFAYAMKAQNRLSPTASPALTIRESGALIKFVGASMFARTGIQIGTFSQSLGFLISHTDLVKILTDKQAAWAAAALAKTPVKSPSYASRMRTFMKHLSRLGIYATAGDVMFGFTPEGVPDPNNVTTTEVE